MRVTCLDWGEGTVIEVQKDPEDSHPVKVKFDTGTILCFKKDGSYWHSHRDVDADIVPLMKE